MNISSTPFIRNDYWPDYNDINQLNQRINEAENETALVNARLTNDIENVSANLNSYMSSQADTVITNNIIVNSLNANYAIGRYANFANTNTDNAYVENLTVNKPVFDLTLNTPHIENATSLGGNFYNTNLIDPKFSGDASGDFNTVNVDVINANTANIGNLFVNTQPEPITSSAVLGFDREGKVIPVQAVFNVGFPKDADYLWTDFTGTAHKGVKATEIGAVENLITAYGVKNAIDALNAEVLDNFNLVTNALNDIDQWQNTFENAVANSFNDVNNTFNDVNNFVNASLNTVNNKFNTVNNKFNTVNNTFNNVNRYINNVFNNVNNSFNNVNNSFNNVNNRFNNVNNRFNNVNNSFNNVNNTANNLLDNVGYLKTALAPLLSLPVANVSGWVDSENPVNIQGITSFVVAPFVANTMTGTDVGDGAKLNVSGTTATLGLPGFQWTMKTMDGTFADCVAFNQNVQIPYGVTRFKGPFSGCKIFNQNILIPNSVTNMREAFGAMSLDTSTFEDISCPNLNQCILIPNSVTDMSLCFRGCNNLRQPDMYIYSQNITSMSKAFQGCHINKIHIPTSVPKSTSNFMYNCLVNGNTGITFPAANIFNDLPVDIRQWPPV